MRPTQANPCPWLARQSLTAKPLHDTSFAENAFDENNLLHVYKIIIIVKWRIIQYEHYSATPN